MPKIYYLDLFKEYVPTEKPERIIIRKSLKRDEVMAYRLKLQRNLCFFCGSEITIKDHLDHLVPIYHGGTNRLSNLVASCKSCNLIKSTQQIEVKNPYTIADYLRLQKAYKKYKDKPYRLKEKKYRLALKYRANLFKAV